MKNKLINRYTIILFIVIFFHVSNNIYFLYRDNMPLVYDTYSNHILSVENYNQFKQGNFSGFVNHYLFPHDSPLITWPSLFLYPIFGTLEDVTAFQGTIFLIILIIATYLLGKELFNKDVGLLVAILLSFSPFVLAISKVPYEDIAFAAMFTLTLYFFIKSRKFSDIKYIWLFNFSLALSLLSKFSFIFVVLISAFSYFFLKLLFYRKDFKNYFSKLNKRNIKHFLISFFVSMMIPTIIFYNALNQILTNFYRNNYLINSGFFNILTTIKNFIVYWYMNFEYFSFFILFVISLVFFLFFSKKNKLLIVSLILAANIYYFLLLHTIYMSLADIFRYSIFIKPLYMIIISLFLLDHLYIFISRLFKNIKVIDKRKYSVFLIIISLLILIPFTIAFNYTDKLSNPIKLNPNFGKYKIAEEIYDYENLLDEMKLHSVNENLTIFFFSNSNDFITSFDSYIIQNYRNIQLINFWVIDPSIEFNNHFNSFFIEKANAFNLNMLGSFDYIIIADNLTDSSNFDDLVVYHKQIKDYLFKNPDKFSLFEILQSADLETNMLVYRNSIK